MVDSPLIEENHEASILLFPIVVIQPLIKTERICFAALHNVL